MLRLIQTRRFVFTLLWVGFILAISFLEAPLKFQAESVTIPIGLEIGYLVFHALNGIEIAFAAILLIISFTCKTPFPTLRLLIIVIGWLLIQTIMLYGPLDQRTLAIISGETVPEAPWHLIYIGMEVVKLFLLLRLAHLQMNDFEMSAGHSAKLKHK
ncbi:MAG: hypothetical protein AAGD96_02780 [Chloroflexota bacterium]